MQVLIPNFIANPRQFQIYLGRLCEFNITSEKNGPAGVLPSPGYPNQYEQNVRCEYHFISKGTERVQVIFTDFDLYHPDNDNDIGQPIMYVQYTLLKIIVLLGNRIM